MRWPAFQLRSKSSNRFILENEGHEISCDPIQVLILIKRDLVEKLFSDITLDDKPLGTKMPALETFKETLHRKDNKALEVLLRIRRFHVTSALKQSTENSLPIMSSSSFWESYAGQENTDSCESIEAGEKGSATYESIKLPTLPFSTVLKGQRLSVGGKEKWKGEHKSEKGEPKERHTVHVDQKLREKGKIVVLENNKMKSPAIKTPRRTVLKNNGKDPERPALHLPKVDKYEVTSNGSYFPGKICRVFRLNDLKTSLIDTGHTDSWVPARDKYFPKYSVFKAITQQPIVYLRQPSPVAGVKIALKDHGSASYADLIRAVEKTNAPAPLNFDGFHPKSKKFIVKLPPIC